MNSKGAAFVLTNGVKPSSYTFDFINQSQYLIPGECGCRIVISSMAKLLKHNKLSCKFCYFRPIFRHVGNFVTLSFCEIMV